MTIRLAVALAAVLCAYGCSGSPASPDPFPIASGDPGPPVSAPPTAYLVGAGDIADCGPGAALTSALVDRLEGTVFTTGDNAYPNGSTADYQKCYDPAWGRHRSRTRPTPGNHDYYSPEAAPYFEYFGPSAGPPGLGYYSYTLGAWRVVALNSEIDAGIGSPQERWLRADLAANPSKCTVAYWHTPVFSSGKHGGSAAMAGIWRTLYDMNADVVIAGHEHIYERFSPLDDAGRVDWTRGIRQFTVGTGGTTLHQVRSLQASSEMTAITWGVLALTLEADSYRWRFVTVGGGTADQGSGACH